MPENVVDQIVAELRSSAAKLYPHRPELRNIRVVGHTPKPDHYIYDIVLDLEEGNQRVAAKVYRASKCGVDGARRQAKAEVENLAWIHNIFQKRKLDGVPRPLGDFTGLGAVVTEKVCGLPLQSIIMKAALLPGFSDRVLLTSAAEKAGEWLRHFHKATADMASPFDADELMTELEKVCQACRGAGLDDASLRNILSGARAVLNRNRKSLSTSAVLNDFSPLSVIVGEDGVGIADYSHLQRRGRALNDAAQFLACVEALEKYPFCNRAITADVQEQFLTAYGALPSERAVLRVLKMKTLLAMFPQGRTIKESAVRKKVMWATVMKKFIHQAAQRSLAPAA
jgi:hypothetical protein